jgi:hypothetical protein
MTRSPIRIALPLFTLLAVSALSNLASAEDRICVQKVNGEICVSLRSTITVKANEGRFRSCYVRGF